MRQFNKIENGKFTWNSEYFTIGVPQHSRIKNQMVCFNSRELMQLTFVKDISVLDNANRLDKIHILYKIYPDPIHAVFEIPDPTRGHPFYAIPAVYCYFRLTSAYKGEKLWFSIYIIIN